MAFVKLTASSRHTFLIDVGNDDPGTVIGDIFAADLISLGPVPGADVGPNVILQVSHIVAAEPSDHPVIETSDPLYGFLGGITRP